MPCYLNPYAVLCCPAKAIPLQFPARELCQYDHLQMNRILFKPDVTLSNLHISTPILTISKPLVPSRISETVSHQRAATHLSGCVTLVTTPIFQAAAEPGARNATTRLLTRLSGS